MSQPLDLSAQAEVLDRDDKLHSMRNEFVIPTKADIKRQTLVAQGRLLLDVLYLKYISCD